METTSTSAGGLVWQNFSASVFDNTIVHSFSGYVPNGQLCGILGPSGSGKSTFLSALGQTPASVISTSGNMFLLSSSSSAIEKHIDAREVAWLQQEDSFFDALTVKETLEMTTFLELPDLSTAEREEMIQTTLNSLGLEKLSSRQIGHKLSGGECRRLSIAQELVTTPELFLADEPTNGLDSFLGEKVMKLIQTLSSDRNIPALCSLHQPRSSIWKLLDRIILMAPRGRVCYMGPRNDAVPYFRQLGYPCPDETNPAEFLVDLVSIDTDDPIQAIQDEIRIERLFQAFTAANHNDANKKSDTQHKQSTLEKIQQEQLLQGDDSRGSFHPFRRIRRFGALFQRSLRQNFRAHFVNQFRFVSSIGNALLFAQIFPTIPPGLPPSPSSVADRVTLLSFGVINMCMMAFMKTIDLFSREKPVVTREQRRNLYSPMEYLLSKSLAELPLDAFFAAVFTIVLKQVTGLRISLVDITATFSLMTVVGASMGFAISSFSPTKEAATTLGVPILVILLVVGVINPSGVDVTKPPPLIIQYLRQLSPFGTAIRALCLAEFRGMEFVEEVATGRGNFLFRGFRKFRNLPKMGALALVQNGDQVLEALGLNDETYSGTMTRMMKLVLLNLSISWLGLFLDRNPQQINWFKKRGNNNSWWNGIINKSRRKEQSQNELAVTNDDDVDTKAEKDQKQQNVEETTTSTSTSSSSNGSAFSVEKKQEQKILLPTPKVKI